MGNTQTVGRKHHHNTHTKKQGRHNIVRHTKGRHNIVRHTKGRRRHRYYQRGGEETKAAEAAAAAPAADAAADTKAPAPAAPAAEKKKDDCPPGCQPKETSIFEKVTSSPAKAEELAKGLENGVTGFFGNKKEEGKKAVGEALSNAGDTLKGIFGKSDETKPIIVAETKVGGKRKRKTNKRRKHKKL